MMFQNTSGYLELFIGPMFSDKTSSLLKEVSRWSDIGAKTCYINFEEDVRNTESKDENVTTHSSQFNKLSSKVKPFKTKVLSSLDIKEFDVIGIDEGQFFPDLLTTVKKWVNDESKIVYCSGLDGDYNNEIFGEILFLIPVADKVTKSRAKCFECLKVISTLPSVHFSCAVVDAPFTGRIISSKEKKIIGGGDIYKPLCRFHYLKNKENNL